MKLSEKSVADFLWIDYLQFIDFRNYSWPPFKDKDLFAKWFQTRSQSIEWQAAKIIHEKYKRKLELTYEDLLCLIVESEMESRSRLKQGKSVNKDILIQKLSNFCKSELKEEC